MVGEHGFRNHEGVPESMKTLGAQRRSIKNHSQLAAVLERRYGSAFQSVQLENMKLGEQIELFRQAVLVIGQHGAGLNNVVWMKNEGGAVIELGRPLVPTFINLCGTKGLRIKQLHKDTEGHLSVEPEFFTKALQELEDEIPELESLCL